MGIWAVGATEPFLLDSMREGLRRQPGETDQAGRRKSRGCRMLGTRPRESRREPRVRRDHQGQLPERSMVVPGLPRRSVLLGQQQDQRQGCLTGSLAPLLACPSMQSPKQTILVSALCCHSSHMAENLVCNCRIWAWQVMWHARGGRYAG